MSEVIEIFITIIIFIVFPAIGILLSVILSERQEQERGRMLKKLFGYDIKIEHGFPIDQNVEEIIQGGLKLELQKYRELIIGDKWLFIQLSGKLPALTLFEDRTRSTVSLYALDLETFTPTIVIRNKHNRSFVTRHLNDSFKKGELIWCEATYDKDHNIYNEPGSHIDTLSILSPEVLEVLKNAPGNADIMVKRNKMYYILTGLSAEKILPSLIEHSAVAARELNNNLKRWSRSSANTEKLEKIKSTELSVTLRERYERQRH